MLFQQMPAPTTIDYSQPPGIRDHAVRVMHTFQLKSILTPAPEAESKQSTHTPTAQGSQRRFSARKPLVYLHANKIQNLTCTDSHITVKNPRRPHPVYIYKNPPQANSQTPVLRKANQPLLLFAMYDILILVFPPTSKVHQRAQQTKITRDCSYTLMPEDHKPEPANYSRKIPPYARCLSLRKTSSFAGAK